MMMPLSTTDSPDEQAAKAALLALDPSFGVRLGARRYRLGPRVIQLTDGEVTGWLKDEFWEEQYDERPILEGHGFHGRAWLADGFLWLKGWSLHTASAFHHPAEYSAALAKLPPWPFWAARWAVYGFDTLIDCRTGGEVSMHYPEQWSTAARMRRIVEAWREREPQLEPGEVFRIQEYAERCPRQRNIPTTAEECVHRAVERQLRGEDL